MTTRDDLRFAYAAWRLGSKIDMLHFEPDADMAGPEWVEYTAEFLIAHYAHAFTLFAKTHEGKRPAGIALLHQPDKRAGVLWMADVIWFPWASSRNKLESIVNFMNSMRKQWLIFEFAIPAETPFFDHVCRYGVMRRAGTVFDLYTEPASVFQTRKLR